MKIFFDIFLNFLGLILYFIIRYINRTGKSTEFSMKFWITDNKWQSIAILICDAIIMILTMAGGLVFDLTKLFPTLPGGIAFIGDMAVYCVIGLVLSHALYELLQPKKVEIPKSEG
jgi:hypothetical protein